MINNKQFLISDDPITDNAFLSYPLCTDQYLSVHKNLNVQMEITENNKVKFALMGFAFECNPLKSSPFTQLKEVIDASTIPELTESWSGRWILLYQDTIYLDACGLFGCYYTDSMLSSSIALLTKQLHLTTKKPKMKKQFGLDFYPGPSTPYKEISHLFPGQTIRVTDHLIQQLPLLSARATYENDETRTEAFIRFFSTMLKNFATEYDGEIKLPLTGGYDSRTLMALLEYSHIPYTTFTLEHSDISAEDISLPPRIAADYNKKYDYIKRIGKPDKKKYQEYDLHCGYMVIDEDRNFYAYDQYPAHTKNTAVLRAGIWECSREYFRNIGDGTSLEDYKKAFVNIRHRTDLQDSLSKWITYVKKNPSSINWINRFYIDQRVGNWLSNVEQSLAVIPNMDSLQLCNSKLLISILLDYDYDTRFSKEHQIMIIRKACPSLLSYGFPGDNPKPAPPISFAKKITKKFKTLQICLSCLGLRETIQILLHGE